MKTIRIKDNDYLISDLALVACLLTSYFCFFVATMLRIDAFIHIFSPLTAILTGSLIIKCLSRMGAFWIPSFVLAMGILMWAMADILTLLNTFFFNSESIYSLTSFIFLLPNYFFGGSVAIYFIQKLKGRELYQFLINTFTLSIISLVLFKKILEHLRSFEKLQDLDLIRIYLYFFINLFIIIMIAHMTYMIASETGLKGTNTMIIGIALYIIMDIPYTYEQALGNHPENIYGNLLYMLCMMLMAHGIYHQIYHKHAFVLRTFKYTDASVKRSRMTVMIGIVVCLILFISRFLTSNEFFYLLIAILGYWIMTSTFQNGALNEQLIKQQDLLTGLYNRRYSATVLSEAVKRAESTNTHFAIYCIDLNNFKPINDFYGHEMGDNVLKEFGRRMLELSSDHVSFRTGGDEFMIVKTNLTDDSRIKQDAEELQRLFNSPIMIGTYVFHLSGSIGISVYPGDSKDTGTLIRYADAAMYSVKHSGHKDGYRLFDHSLIESVEKHNKLEEMLERSDPAKDFVLYYQPRISAGTGKLIGVEAFPRIKADDSFPAAQFLPIAEEVGLMNRLNIWIAETGIRQLNEWNKADGTDIYISLNLSALQLLDRDFIEHLKSLTKQLELDASKIHLDISNEVIMGAGNNAKDTLKELNSFGFQLALNDFGGDDINLQHILDCGFSSIHISPSLIRKSDTDEAARILIHSIIALAESMKIAVSAVGIESAGQEAFLKGAGVYALQGYHYGKPEKKDEFERTFLSHSQNQQ
ncbi:MAG: EAL domain-containing protein [Lachnospiraceae bacterium]|nr:EAL domain-containing protein [Lachnospiraceae bacterium]